MELKEIIGITRDSIKEFHRERRKAIEDLKEHFEKRIREKKIQIVSALPERTENFAGVDSAMKEIGYAGESLYLSIVISHNTKYIDGRVITVKDRPGQEDKLLKSMSLMSELIMASSLDQELIFMDGSIITFITAMKWGLERAEKTKGGLAEQVIKLYPQAVKSLTKLLQEKRVFFFPKKSSREELAEELSINLSEWIVADMILKKGQAIELKFREKYIKRFRLRKASSLLKELKKIKIMYFKGYDGQIYKAEGIEFPLGKFLHFATGGTRRQIYPVEMCDKLAKDIISPLIKQFEQEALPWWTELE